MFVGRFGTPWRRPPPTQAALLSKGNVVNAALSATMGDFTLATAVDVPRTDILSASFGNFTLSTVVDVPRTVVVSASFETFTLTATAGQQTVAIMSADMGSFTIASALSRGFNCPKFSAPTITGAIASSEVYPRC